MSQNNDDSRSSSEGVDSDAKVVALIGVPTDIGAADRGASMGPEALRVAGIEAEIRRQGRQVVDRGNVNGPSNPQLPRDPKSGYRHLDETVLWCSHGRDEIYKSLNDKQLPIMLGGDHSMGIASLSAVSRYCEEQGKNLRVLWLDAHADFNAAASSPSGNIHGMPVAVLCGDGPDKLLNLGHKRPMMSAHQFTQIGIRSVDADERRRIAGSGLQVYDMRAIDELGMRRVMESVLDDLAKVPNCHLHVSLDVDFLDPSIAPGVGTTVQGGPSYREAQLCMEMIADTGLMASMDIVELNPAFDTHNRTARVAIELAASLFGKRILIPVPAKN